MLIVLTFLILSLLSFGVLLIALRPSSKESEFDARLRAVLVASAPKGTADPSAQTMASKPASLFDGIEELLQQTKLMHHLRVLLQQAQSDWRAGTLIFSTVLIGVVAMVACYAVTSNALFSLVACGSGCGPYCLLRMKRSRRMAAFNAALPAAIEMCSRSLRAGHSLPAAIGTLAEEAAEPVRTEFSEVFRKQNYGLPLREALMEMLERVPSRDLRILITGILVQKDTGGNLPEIMDRIVAVVRDRVRIQADVQTHTAQGRMTGWILCLLPIGLLLLINLMNPGYSKALFHDPFGRKLLYTGMGLLAIGAFTIRRIVQGIEV
jgi:tight adherence protein B